MKVLVCIVTLLGREGSPIVTRYELKGVCGKGSELSQIAARVNDTRSFHGMSAKIELRIEDGSGQEIPFTQEQWKWIEDNSSLVHAPPGHRYQRTLGVTTESDLVDAFAAEAIREGISLAAWVRKQCLAALPQHIREGLEMHVQKERRRARASNLAKALYAMEETFKEPIDKR